MTGSYCNASVSAFVNPINYSLVSDSVQQNSSKVCIQFEYTNSSTTTVYLVLRAASSGMGGTMPEAYIEVTYMYDSSGREITLK